VSRDGPGPARLLARGWARDARRWTWATTAVLAATLGLLLGTAGLIDGTMARTLDQVADFYTGDLRVTPSQPGALPADWFADGAVEQLRGAGATVAARVEGQYVLSRRGFVDAFAGEREGVPVGVPGGAPDPERAVHLGSLVGLDDGDPGASAIAAHLVEGRLPRAGGADMEVVMSVSRARSLLTAAEREVPGPLLRLVGEFRFDVTSAQLDPGASSRTLIHRNAKVVGLFATGVDMLDTFTLVAAAPDVRGLLAQDRAGAVNAILVLDGAAAAHPVAARNGWATEDTRTFAGGYVGQLVAVLQAAAWLVTGLLFLLPTLLVGHGLARQLSSQQRELAVATAIGVAPGTLARALSVQVLAMAGWAVAAAAALCLLLVLVLPAALQGVPAPLPLGFAVTWASVGVAAAVTALSVLAGLWVGLRSRARLPLAAVLRTG
jgi:hypothetical protein